MDARETIRRAYRALRVIGLGRNPSSAMADEGLKALEGMISQLVGFGGGLPIITKRISGSYDLNTSWPAMRLQCTSAGVTITAPDGDGAVPIYDGYRVEIVDLSGLAGTSPITFARNESLIDGAAANDTLAVSLGRKSYFYRQDRGDWRPIEALTLDSIITDQVSGAGLFPADFDETLPRMLAKRVGSGVGQSLLEDDADLAAEGERRMRARYCKPPPMAYPIAVSNMGGGGFTVADSSYDGEGLY